MEVHNFEYAGIKALQGELAARSVPDGNNVLIQCFVGRVDKDAIAELQGSIRSCLPNSTLIGATSAGGIIDGKFSPQNPIISISVFDKATISSSFVVEKNEEKLAARVASEVIRNDSKLMILFSDGLTTNGDNILQSLYPHTNDIMVAGGRAGDGAFTETFIFDKDRISDTGAVAACVNGDVTVVNRYYLNWQPIGKIMTITDVEGNVLKSINHQPVRDVYRKYLGDYVGDNLPVSNTEFPLIKLGPSGQQIARAIIAMTDEDYAVLGGNLEVGDQVQFSYGNVDMIIDETKKSIGEIKSKKPEAMFAYSCAARLGFLGDDVGLELEQFNKLAPSSGFFTFGEYYYSGSSYEMLNGTLTVVGITEQDVQSAGTIDEEVDDTQEPQITPEEDDQENTFQGSQARVLNALINLSNTVTGELVETHKEVDTILDNMPAVVFLRDPEGRFIHVNRRYQEQYGIDADAIVGKTLKEIYPQEMAEDFGAADRELMEAGKNIEKEFTLENDGQKIILNSNMFLVFNEAEEISAYGGAEVDVTERRAAEAVEIDQRKSIKLLHDMAEAVQVAATLDEAYGKCLEMVRDHTGWPICHIYVPSQETPDLLVSSKIWSFGEGMNFDEFRTTTEKTVFKRGEGLPGRVLDSGEPAWIVDVTVDPNFPRAAIAEKSGVKAGLAFPVTSDSGVIAIMEFFTAEAIEPNERLLTIMANVGNQLGNVIERKTAEERLHQAYEVISSSINYASRIQRSILPDENMMDAVLEDYFVLWEPRDVVGGDIYWAGEWGPGFLLVLGDCTGHGVPGAFMTLISMGALERAKSEVEAGNVGALLTRMHQFTQMTLSQHFEGGESDDGIELGALYIVPGENEMIYSGARFELLISDGQELTTIKGTKAGAGYRGIPFDQEYAETKIAMHPELCFYMSTDGLTDQIGGIRKRMFGKKRLRELISSAYGKPMSEQKKIIHQAVVDFQGDEKRRDDMAVIGFKI